MKLDLVIQFLLVCLLLLASCGAEGNETLQEDSDSVADYQISPVDSFGVEVGDSLNMIGSINGFCHAADGSLVLLDRTAMKVRIVSNTGQVSCWGIQGEGPGEFQFPQGICTMSDGRILVSDTYRREIMEFDISGNYQGSYISEEQESIPANFFQVDSNSILGNRLDFEIGEDQYYCSYFVGRFDSSTNPSIRFEEFVSDLSTPEIYNKMDCLDYLADPSGNVYIALDNTEYIIEVLSADGVLEYTIHQDIARIPKTETEIQAELDEYEQYAMRSPLYPSGYEPTPFHPLISLAGVDHLGNLWVQRHNPENQVHFDVFDSAGDLVFTASLDNSAQREDMDFRIDAYGILGAVVDSDEYPRIYRFELDH